jgi:predicted DNA-binding transcriptional regulator AlpA
MLETESEWLGGARTAAYLGVTAMTIWRWERDPKLAFPAASVIHGRKYWNRTDIDAWMRRMAIRNATAIDKVAATGPAKVGGRHD